MNGCCYKMDCMMLAHSQSHEGQVTCSLVGLFLDLVRNSEGRKVTIMMMMVQCWWLKNFHLKKPPFLMFVFAGQRVVMTKNRRTWGLTRTPKRFDHPIYCHSVIMVIFSITWPWQIFDQVFVEHLSHDQWFFGCKAKHDPFNAVISTHVLIASIITVIVISSPFSQ